MPELVPDHADRLRLYVEVLQRWNRAINLVGRRDMADVWERHIQDSLQLGTIGWPLPARAIDLGSGAGFPGLILSIAFGLPVDLIEEDQRKAAFLREAARVTGARAVVHAVKIEMAKIPPAPLVTARALAPLHRLLSYAAPLLTPEGECWFLKGTTVDAELAEAAAHWSMRVQKLPSRTAGGGVLLRVSELCLKR